MEIKETENGWFQVWHQGKILNPFDSTLCPHYFSGFRYMYYQTRADAEKAIDDYKYKYAVIVTGQA